MTPFVDKRNDPPKHINDRHPNFYSNGNFYLVRCFARCHGEYGRENWAMAVKSGECSWCGWREDGMNDVEE